MCGISGVYTTDSSALCERHVGRIADSRQFARGPNFQMVTTIAASPARAIMGNNRLSIIDLSPAGNQPLWDGGQQVCIVFNGEIYNYVELKEELKSLGHRFLSTSDAEVILESFKRWGIDAISRLNGMFAFALFDARDGSFYLVRDRFGVKPLYYVAQDKNLYFASTARTIAVELSLTPDLQYLSDGVRYGLWEHDDAAPYTGMKALRPGHFLRVEAATATELSYSLQPYYDFMERTTAMADSLASISIRRAAKKLGDLLEDAVRLRLRADVPVATSLSGGLDSSTIAVLAAEHHSGHLEGFTFGEPHCEESEGPLVCEFSRMTGINVTYVWPDIDEIVQSFDETTAAQEGPFISGSMMAQYLVFQAARKAGFKVLLGGQGGDEAFMGYHKFQVFHLRRLLAQKKYPEALGFLLSLVPTVIAERSIWAETWSNRQRYLRQSGLGTALRLPEGSLEIGYNPQRPLYERQVADIALGSLPTLLRYEDCNSMGNNIESRLPFLDYRVMEMGVALPETLKLRHGRGKWIIREALKGRLPESIRNPRFKRGFDVQQQHWIDEGLGDHIRALLKNHHDIVAEYLASGVRIEEAYSNERLKTEPTAFAEATTLLWIARAQEATTT
ncbi:MAG: asparagine synthase (glutamine-hydrolyzing) [Thermoleophilia bacterium]|jgi:asparagine synthase (glutamine-hydrolysing)